jgi:hypothetical protein
MNRVDGFQLQRDWCEGYADTYRIYERAVAVLGRSYEALEPRRVFITGPGTNDVDAWPRVHELLAHAGADVVADPVSIPPLDGDISLPGTPQSYTPEVRAARRRRATAPVAAATHGAQRSSRLRIPGDHLERLWAALERRTSSIAVLGYAT